MSAHNSSAATEMRPPVLEDIDVLLALARDLATITSVASLRDALAGPLRPLLPSHDISVLRAVGGGAWEALAGPEDAVERLHEYSWTPLVADHKTIGNVGMGAPAVGAPTGKLADAIVALVAGSIQQVIVLENVRQDSVRDSLTGCFNRAHALDALEGNMRRANRTNFPVSVMMIDVDDFKRINDRYGHVPGDSVLAAVGEQLHTMLRQSDVRCRLGGDEFLVILPDTTHEDAMRVAESVRQAIEGLTIPSVRGKMTVTASIGVATAACGGAVDVAAFIDRADVALYRAKQAGRNGVQACTTSALRARQTNLRLAARPA